MAYKMTDALRIYYHWTGLEGDYNDTKTLMLIAYTIGIGLSAMVTMYMLNRFFKKEAEKKARMNEE